MTLILKPENNLQGKSRYKNAYWELKGTTPNEEFEYSSSYRSFISKFIRQTALPVRPKWFEVRIIKDNPSPLFQINREDHWYALSSFMDRAFWMFMKPVEERVAGESVTYYVLEPYECMRVQGLLGENHGRVMPKQIQPFLVPTECCSICWEETANGVSEHLHHRPEKVKTQEQIDREHQRAEGVKDLMAHAEDISNNLAIAAKLKGFSGRLEN